MENAVNSAGNAAAAQVVVDIAQAKVKAVTDLKVDYDTAAWDGVISAQQKVVDQMKEDELKASAVIKLIEALPAADKVTVANKGQIEAAREAYKLLTDNQKELVDVTILEKAEEALKQAIEATPPFYTGKVAFKATKNGSTFTTTNKEIDFFVNDEGFKEIKISMGDVTEDFKNKVGNFTITEEIVNGTTYFRVITDKEYYASKTQTWRANADSVDTSIKGTVKFQATLTPYLSIESQQFYDWFTKK